MSKKNKNTNQSLPQNSKNILLWFSLAVAGMICIKLIPHFMYPLWTYGYDSGFYAYALKNASVFQLLSSVPGIVSGFTTPALLLVKWLPFSVNVNLLILIVLAETGFAISLFYFLKNKSLLLVYFAILFFSFSQIQTQVELFFLLKTLVALPFFILGIKFFEEKKWWLFILISLIIIWFHRTTAIVFLLSIFGSLAVNLAYSKKWKNLIFGVFSLSTLVFVALMAFKEQFLSIFNHASQDVVNGIFFQGHSLTLAIWLTLPLSIFGGYLAIKEKKLPTIISLFIVTGLWFIFKLPFYQRILIYFDLALIILSAQAIAIYLKNKTTTTKLLVTLSLVCLLSFGLIKFLNTSTPLIDADSLNAISSFSFPESNGFIFSVDANDAPWFRKVTK
jgi:hypothetical protein